MDETPTPTVNPAPTAEPTPTTSGASSIPAAVVDNRVELHKLCVSGFPKYMNPKQVEKIFEGKVEYDGMKRKHNTFVAILKFTTAERMEKAKVIVETLTCKGKQLRAYIANSSTHRDRPYHDGGGDNRGGKRFKSGNEGKGGAGGDADEAEGDEEGGGGAAPAQPKTLNEAVTPLLHLPYEEQTRRKQEDMMNLCITKMFKEIRKTFHQRNYLNKQNQKAAFVMPPWLIAGSQEFRLEDIRPSPTIGDYRNKCEFTVGRDEADQATVGFRRGVYQVGVNVVENPRACIHVDDQSKKVVDAVQAFIRSSALPTYSIMTHTGVWRFLTVRSSQRTGQCLIMLCVSLTKGVPLDLWQQEEKKLVAYLTAPSQPILPMEMVSSEQQANGPDTKTWTGITSIFLQPYEGVSNPNSFTPISHLWGKHHIEEKLFDLTFRISPNAFFQTNTAGAEVLYSVVMDSLGLDSSSKFEGEGSQRQAPAPTVLDICCGTGTIGICTAMKKSNIKMVLGVEMCENAVEDAKANAKANGVATAKFVCSKAEDILYDALKHGEWEYEEGDQEAEEISRHLYKVLKERQPVVAIVDPPRDGLHVDCLRAIRNCPLIKRLVYVSCNPTKSLVRDSIMLCGPKSKSLLGEAFHPVNAIPVDMFPHTTHCELVMVFERGVSPAVVKKESVQEEAVAADASAPQAAVKQESSHRQAEAGDQSADAEQGAGQS